MKKIFIGMMTILFPVLLTAQDGTPDPGFGTNGVVVDGFNNNNNNADAIAVQADNKVLVAGNTGTAGSNDMAVARFNEDGTPDLGFGNNGKLIFSTPFIKSFVNDIKIQSDGKIILGGYQWNNSTGDFVLARLNEDGSFDSTFGNGGIAILDNGLDEVGKSIHIHEDGKIIISGDSGDQFTMTRTNPDGSIDTSFGTNGWVRTLFPIWSYSNGMDVNADGEIILTGMTIDNDSNWKIAVAKYNNNGDLDFSFGNGGTLIISIGDDYDFGIKGLFTEEGEILIGAHSYFGTNPLRYEIAVVGLNADGSINTNYGSNGISKFRWLENGENYLNDMVLQADGKLVIAGRSSDANNDYYSVARLNTNGELDPSFANGGKINDNIGLTADTATAIALQEDGKIVFTGYTSDFSNPTKFFIIRLQNGSLKTTDMNLSGFKLYPNPAINEINFEFNGNKEGVSIEIFNMTGQKVLTTKLVNKNKINVSALPSGVYILKANLNGETQIKKFIKK